MPPYRLRKPRLAADAAAAAAADADAAGERHSFDVIVTCANGSKRLTVDSKLD